MPRSGPDSARSWVVAGACCFINCLLYGVARLSGLLMVAAVETFRISRGQAAAPFSVSSSVRNLSGLFVGHLGQHFGVRAVVCAGCLLASLGAGLCFFVQDVWWLTLCWGGLFGTGYGLATCLLPLAINQHFFRNCGTASGISYSGSYIGSFILPPVVVILLDNYGLPGTFLIISGGVLNVLAAAMLFGGKSVKKGAPKTNDFESHSVSVIKDIDSPCKKNTKSNSFWHRLLKSLKCKDTSFKTNKMARSSISAPIDLIATVSLDRDSLQCDHRLHTANNANNMQDIDSFTKTNILIPSASVLPISVPKLSEDSRSLKKISQDKSKMKYKAKLAKLKKIMSISLFKKRHSFKVDLPGVHVENIKLISFRNWNCILCSNIIQMPIHLELLYPRMNLNNNKIIAGDNTDATGMKNESFGGHTNQNSSFPDRHRISSISQPWGNHCTFLLKYQEKAKNGRENDTKKYFPDSISERCFHELSYEYQCQVPRERSSAVSAMNLFLERKKKRSKLRKPRCPSLLAKQTGSCFLGWMFLFREPMFVVISLTMALYSFVIVCVITIIEDFAKDLHVPDSLVHYVLMVLSTADLIGTLTLGFITDRGYMSRRHFLALCFLGMGACTASLSLCTGTASLFACVGCYGLCESGVVITFPLLVAQFMPLRKQAVAIASSNIFSAPTVLLVPLVIGHFRDYLGCYSGVFYLMGVTSVTCGLLWLIAPHIFRRKDSSAATPSKPSIEKEEDTENIGIG